MDRYPLPQPPPRRPRPPQTYWTATWAALALLSLGFIALVAYVAKINSKAKPLAPPAISLPVFYRIENFTLHYLTLNNHINHPTSASLHLSYTAIRSKPLLDQNLTVSTGLPGRRRGFILFHIGRFGPNGKVWSEEFEETRRLTSQEAYDLNSILKSTDDLNFELRIAESETSVRLGCRVGISENRQVTTTYLCKTIELI